MAKLTNKGAIVKKYLTDFPNTKDMVLAKKLHTEHPIHFEDVEQARGLIKSYRGKGSGGNNLKDKSFFGSGFQIPKPKSRDFKPLILRSQDNNIGIISDLHIPNHREEPIRIALEYFREQQVNTIIINGDLLDNTPFSKWEHKPVSGKDVKKWFDMAEAFLAMLRREFPECRILWLEGNHDFWYYKWLIKKAPILFGDEYFHLSQRLHLDKYGIEYIEQERYVLAGKLAICHGHHLVKGIIAPVNAGRGVYMRAKRSVLIGHVHVESSHTETDMDGKIVTCWSSGCMCTLTPEYQPFGGKACHGFSHVKVKAGGSYRVNNYRIFRGEIL